MKKIILFVIAFMILIPVSEAQGIRSGFNSLYRDKTIGANVWDTLKIDSIFEKKTVEITAVADTVKVSFPQGSAIARDTTLSYEIIRPNQTMIFENIDINRIYSVGVSANSRYRIRVYYGDTEKKQYNYNYPKKSIGLITAILRDQYQE